MNKKSRNHTLRKNSKNLKNELTVKEREEALEKGVEYLPLSWENMNIKKKIAWRNQYDNQKNHKNPQSSSNQYFVDPLTDDLIE